MAYEQTRAALLDAMEEMTVIDAHEHLGPEAERLAQDLDVFCLFSEYTRGDLLRAGMAPHQYEMLFDHDLPLEARWNTFSPFWDRIRYTCYSRSVLHTVKHFYGFDDIDQGNYKDISEGIAANNKPGIYKKVLRDACRIEAALTHCEQLDLNPDPGDHLLVPVMRVLLLRYWQDDFPANTPAPITWESLASPTSLTETDLQVDLTIRTLDDFLEKQRIYVRRIKQRGAVAAKMIVYPQYGPSHEPDQKAAQQVFNDLRNRKLKETPRLNPLYHYLLDQAVAFAVEEGLVIAVHTGYWGDIRDMSPLHVIPLLMRYPDARFDLFHLGYPWLRESLNLAKEFSNVYLNFCWLHVISRTAARQAMEEAIETIPVNKISGFGGDYHCPGLEKVFGHLKMAKENIADAFARKVEDGWMGADEAIEVIKKYLYDNPKELYGI